MERILTTHTGSLLRPPELTGALEAIELGRPYDREAFASDLERAVADVVRRQAEAGIDVVDDGELSKPGWINYAYDRVTGIEQRNLSMTAAEAEALLPRSVDREALEGAEGFYTGVWSSPGMAADEATSWVCTGPITYRSEQLDVDLANLRAAVDSVDAVDAFVPAVAPGSAYWLENEYYASEEEFVFALADALGEEYRRIVEAGFILQVDDAVLWHKYGTVLLSGGSPADYAAWAEVRIEALNRALAGIPPERVRYHVCSGSGHGPHTIDPSLADVVEFMLRVNARYYLIEQANARHEHEWRMWEEVELPEDKVLVPGVVTHHTQMVEHPELVAQRLVRLAKVVGRERVMAGTDCGFAQMATVRRVPVWTQWAKLRSLSEGARLASLRLWGAQAAA